MEQIATLKEEQSNMEKTVLHLKERLEEVNLSNARFPVTITLRFEGSHRLPSPLQQNRHLK